jgi:biopolymer transport protein TolQ
MEPSTTPSVIDLAFHSGGVVMAVLILLLGLSVISWAVIFGKFIQLRKALRLSDDFATLFWETRDMGRMSEAATRMAAAPVASIFMAGFRELGAVAREGKQSNVTVNEALNRASTEELDQLERGVPFLATVASAAPFIGLFGTVWGIVNAFHGLSQMKESTLQAVAPGISEALIATAVGLVAAIPAVIAYNSFAVLLKRIRIQMERFKGAFMSFVEAR